ncbi:hypothetical protein KBX26_02820 [Micromonospora sp. C97]|uniref:hypothetical protein n=1 Tax=Micromonospora sp. C97 TaxID=2824883 RepID=UPI001B3631AC|nr:hypothetical protein [Micromonospora sp. C97]MBQ1028940.1 hypothetical protein [Micromonospora sp. C97]
MAINTLARKLLWGRAGDCCAWQGCNQSLTAIAGDEEAGALATQGLILGEEAHIRSSKAGGPRHDPAYPEDQLDNYVNLILLCPTHHTIIDKEGGRGWPIDQILAIKEAHELQVRQSRGFGDQRRQKLEEQIFAQLAVWEHKLGIDDEGEWTNLTFGLNQAIPSMHADRLERLLGLGSWLLSRSWSPELPRVRIAFDRHFAVVQVLLSAITEEIFEKVNSHWRLARPYKHLGNWDAAEYERLLRETNVNATAIWYLTCELSRSANLVIDAVREELDPLYRLDKGMVLTRDGDGILVDLIRRDEYSNWSWESPPPAPSLQKIREVVVAAAEPNDTRVQHVNPRTLSCDN